jgi:hypothetical protein
VNNRLSCPSTDCGTSQDDVYADPSGGACFPSCGGPTGLCGWRLHADPSGQLEGQPSLLDVCYSSETVWYTGLLLQLNSLVRKYSSEIVWYTSTPMK